MKMIISELNSLLKLENSKQVRGRHPERVKELCVSLAASVGTKKAAQISGVCRRSIYNWRRKATQTKSSSASTKKAPFERPFILQEIEVSSMTSPKPKTKEITIVSTSGVKAHLPFEYKILTLVLDRIIGARG